MHRGFAFSIFVLAVAFSLCSASAAAPAATLDARIIPGCGPDGPVTTMVVQPGGPPSEPQNPEGSREYLLWHRYLDDPIYTSVGICAPANRIWAGNYLNPPKQCESIPVEGGGSPSWVFSGTEFYADAARLADVVAALDATPNDSTVVVREWRNGSAAPLWSYPLHPCRPLTGEGWSAGKGVQVSDDGTTIAVVVNMYTPAGLRGRLLLFAAGSGVPIADQALPDGSASALAVSANGAFCAVYCWPYIHVYDRSAHALRWSGSAFSGNDALAISGDGRYIAWGWSNLYLRQWNGSTYALHWQTSKSGYYVTECALSVDNSRFAVAWYNNTAFNENLIDMYDLPAHALQWEYSYSGGSASPAAPVAEPSRDPIEIISEMVFSPDGGFLAASSWGILYPEIHAFDVTDPTPLAEFDTPGSMFDVDICAMGGFVSLTACGKHTHAGISGRGADLYSLGIPWVDGVEGPGPGGTAPALRCLPNPASGPVRIERSGPGGGPFRVSVFDAGGRRIASARSAPTTGPAIWDGRDATGRAVAPGLYLIRSDQGSGDEARVLVIR